MPTKIFIGNVNPNTKADQLRVLFEQYGKVTECDIIKNYAFVHMEYESEANQAIRQLDGYSVCNSRIRVELSHGKKSENAEKKTPEKKFGGKRPLGNQGATGNFNSRFPPGGFGSGNWSGGGGGGGFDQRLPFRSNYPDYYERDGRMPPLHDRYPPGPGPMSDRMGPPPPERYPPQGPPPRDRMMPPHPDRFAPPPDRMRPSSPYDRRPPPPPHAQRDPYYMDRDPYYRERSPLSRPPPDYYDRNPKRDYPLSPYQNNDMGGFKRDAPMGRDMGMRSMGMDAPLRDQMPPGRGGMDPMRRDNMGGRGPGPMGGGGGGGGGRDNYGQGDPMDHPMGNRQMNPMMRDRPGMGGMNNSGGYNNYNGQQSSGGGYNMNNSYSNYNNDRPRPGMDNNYRDGYQGMGGGGGQPPMGNQKKANLPDQSFLQTGPIFF